MSNCIKEYEVLGRRYSIEDFTSPGEHFFDGKGSDGKPRLRFMLWAGGCGIGEAETLDEADTKLANYIGKDVSRKLRDAKTIVAGCQKAIDTINITGGSIAHFKITRRKKP